MEEIIFKESIYNSMGLCLLD